MRSTKAASRRGRRVASRSTGSARRWPTHGSPRRSPRSSWPRSRPRSPWSWARSHHWRSSATTSSDGRRIFFFLVLPIALPGVVTGIALRTSFVTFGVEFGLLTVVIGHATFCVVIAYNNVIARLRRLPRSPEEASADLGADGFTTFRRVTLPSMGTALLSGGLLAFAPLRRDHRDELHGGRGHADRPDADLLRHPAPGRAAGRQRRGTRPHPRVGHPCLHRDAPVLGAASARL